MGRVYPRALLWFDAETPGLPDVNDYSVIPPLEVGCLISDLDFPFNKYTGYHEVLAPTKQGAAMLKKNPELIEMHKSNGLLREWLDQDRRITFEFVDAKIVELFQGQDLEKGEIAIAGSGVGAFDLHLIRQWFPETASYLAYFPWDVGVYRRLTRSYLRGKTEIIPVHSTSYGEKKTHRAFEDVMAHYEENVQFAKWLRNLAGMS